MMKIIEKIKKSQPIRRWQRLKAVFKDFAFKPTVFIVPAGLGLVASILDVASISLLIPTVKGVIERNFIFCRDIFFLGQIIEIFSNVLSPFFENRNSRTFVILIVLIFLTVLLKNITLYFSRIMTLIGSGSFRTTCGNVFMRSIYLSVRRFSIKIAQASFTRF
ncbi:MAG: hypothetical protein GXY64_07435 [Bacteroidales bacterium]|nr:hypothetical protein [Bacteroidales bacterium]